MEVAWKAADEYDARVNLNSLYTMKIVSSTKLNDTINDLSESGDTLDPGDGPKSPPDQCHLDAAGSPSDTDQKHENSAFTEVRALQRPREPNPRAAAKNAREAITAWAATQSNAQSDDCDDSAQSDDMSDAKSATAAPNKPAAAAPPAPAGPLAAANAATPPVDSAASQEAPAADGGDAGVAAGAAAESDAGVAGPAPASETTLPHGDLAPAPAAAAAAL